MRPGKARTGLSAGHACHKRWNAAAGQVPYGPEVGTVCGKAARTDLCGGRSAMGVPAQQQTQTIPIVFLLDGDPVVDGVVQNIARLEGNITGFSGFPPSIAGKWLELLKQVAPHLDRIAIIFNPEFARTGPSYIGVLEPAAAGLGVQTIVKVPAHTVVDVVRGIASN